MQTRTAQQQILELLSKKKKKIENFVIISLLPANTKYFNVVARLQEITLVAFNSVLKKYKRIK